MSCGGSGIESRVLDPGVDLPYRRVKVFSEDQAYLLACDWTTSGRQGQAVWTQKREGSARVQRVGASLFQSVRGGVRLLLQPGRNPETNFLPPPGDLTHRVSSCVWPWLPSRSSHFILTVSDPIRYHPVCYPLSCCLNATSFEFVAV